MDVKTVKTVFITILIVIMIGAGYNFYVAKHISIYDYNPTVQSNQSSAISNNTIIDAESKFVGSWTEDNSMSYNGLTFNSDHTGIANGSFYGGRTVTFDWRAEGNKLYISNWTGSRYPIISCDVAPDGSAMQVWWESMNAKYTKNNQHASN